MRIFLILILIFSFCLSSCVFDSNRDISFKVVNQLDRNIDSLFLSNGYDVNGYNKILKVKDSITLELKFSKNLPKGDGSYEIKIFGKNEVMTYNFGYYTNGYPFNNNEYRIFIYNDSVSVLEIVK
jgi:hypothetical protein